MIDHQVVDVLVLSFLNLVHLDLRSKMQFSSEVLHDLLLSIDQALIVLLERFRQSFKLLLILSLFIFYFKDCSLLASLDILYSVSFVFAICLL